MTAPHLDLRRRPTKPAGNLFRVTAAVSFLSFPLVWEAYLLFPLAELESCTGDGNAPCPLSLDTGRGFLHELGPLLATACVELVVIACYLAWATARRTLDLRTGLRWSPIAIVIVALAVGGFGWLIDGGDLSGPDAVEPGLVLLFALWLFTPLAVYGVHRGDRRAVIPVVIGLAPTAAVNAYVVPEAPIGTFPAVMLVVAVLTVVVVRRRE